MMWMSALTAGDPLDDFEDLRHVDMGRAEQFRAELAAEFGEDVMHRQAGLLEKRAPGERQAVAVDAVAGDADDPVAGLEVAADDDAVERHGADCGADQIEAADHVGQLRNLAAGDRDAGLPRALGEARRDARRASPHRPRSVAM